jgi:hypothetical protein
MNNYAVKIVNVMVIVFPLLFAANVYISVNKENTFINAQDSNILSSMTQQCEVNLDSSNSISSDACGNSASVLYNATFAVLLAFTWTLQKAIKLGTI